MKLTRNLGREDLEQNHNLVSNEFSDLIYYVHIFFHLFFRTQKEISPKKSQEALWNLITYCAATGGSLLVIGSAAGVAFMGMEQGVSFGWYLKAIGPAALVGYFFGVAGMMGQQAAGLAARRMN